MIQQIYITDYLSDAAARPADMIQSLVEQCPVFLRAQWQVHSLSPLKSLWQCLGASGDATSAVLYARMPLPVVPSAFCLLPVHLGLRRDTFSLQSVVPLAADVYAVLTERLKKHFLEEFTIHEDPSQRYWWVVSVRDINAQTQWPQDCLYQQAMHWQPQGPDASVIRQWTNEIQMLLHEAAYSPAVTNWPETLNSLWFASVGHIPAWPAMPLTVSGQGDIFSGLQASRLGAAQFIPMSTMFADQQMTDGIWVADEWQAVNWAEVSRALQTGRISALRVVIPFAERSIEIGYKKQFRWQFWRKLYTLETLLQQLETTLAAAR